MSKILKNSSSSKGSGGKKSSSLSLSSRISKHSTLPNTILDNNGTGEASVTKSALLSLNSLKGQSTHKGSNNSAQSSSVKLSSWPKVGGGKVKVNLAKLPSGIVNFPHHLHQSTSNSNVVFNNKTGGENSPTQSHQWYEFSTEGTVGSNNAETSSDIAAAAVMWKCESSNGHGRTKRVCTPHYYLITVSF
jgi:hypothetical protein